MKKYTSPEMEIVKFDSVDVITTSNPIETPEDDLK